MGFWAMVWRCFWGESCNAATALFVSRCGENDDSLLGCVWRFGGVPKSNEWMGGEMEKRGELEREKRGEGGIWKRGRRELNKMRMCERKEGKGEKEK